MRGKTTNTQRKNAPIKSAPKLKSGGMAMPMKKGGMAKGKGC